MPTYVYKNLETGELYEFKQSMKDEAYTHHPETGAPVKRLISPPAIAFKGSGFYANDSRQSTSKSASATQAKSEKTANTEQSTSPAISAQSSGDSG
ncbi:FmdB family zinc ribbon protein [Deinococcus radiophilus]|uniref:FmdB family transcriptional regulator n=1 Tax=Deinococcus radiophilus TaxID=32062 RepID=A0A431W496_9DEIO|nr:FmdB family transcriptional regulator [Deinococcus radiophilus]RTR30306.1 FmdB family transcriptional regulator [Deinococcus radiophilus]